MAVDTNGMETTDALVALREMTDLRIAALAELVEQRFVAMDTALNLQLVETLRRLEDLNHAHALAREVQATYLPRELHDTMVADVTTWRTAVEARNATFVTFEAMDRRNEALDRRIADAVTSHSRFLPREVFETYTSIPFLPREVHEQYAREQRTKADELAAAIVRLQEESRQVAETLVRTAAERAEGLVKTAVDRAETLAVSVDRRFVSVERRVEEASKSQADYLLRAVFDQVLADFTDWRRQVDVKAATFVTVIDADKLLRRDVFENYISVPFLPREVHDNYAKDQASRAEVLALAITRAAAEARTVAEALVQTATARSDALALAVDRRADQVDQRLGALDVRLAGAVTKSDAMATDQRHDERFSNITDALAATMTRDEIQGRMDQFRSSLGSVTTSVTTLSSELAGQAMGTQGVRTSADRNRSLVFGLLAAAATVVALLVSVAGFTRPPASTPTTPPPCSVVVAGVVCTSGK